VKLLTTQSDPNLPIKFAVFRDNDTPRYIKAFIAHIVVYGIQLAAIVFLRVRLMRLNVLKRRALAVSSSEASGGDPVYAFKLLGYCF
jgi:hypothetical protein